MLTLIIFTLFVVINSSIVKNKIIFQNANITLSKYKTDVVNVDGDLRKFKDLDKFRFDKYFKIKIGNYNLILFF